MLIHLIACKLVAVLRNVSAIKHVAFIYPLIVKLIDKYTTEALVAIATLLTASKITYITSMFEDYELINANLNTGMADLLIYIDTKAGMQVHLINISCKGL